MFWSRPCTAKVSTPVTPFLQASYEYLKSVCGSMTMVQGDLDDGIRAPDSAVVKLGDLKIGLCHGHQLIVPGDREAVAALQRRMGVDVLLLGHTHSVQVYKTDDGFVINPGSATGAPCPASLSPTPSFVLMDIDGSKVCGVEIDECFEIEECFVIEGCFEHGMHGTAGEGGGLGLTAPGRANCGAFPCPVYVYELVDGEVKVDKVDFVKPSAAAQSVAA
ncbi:hypothetical protein H632_c1763p0 [Helicosporidium sp. ATCC 50920]|nr:hypothetical protein H632_c1763p0 [Helicosporidium sp. ATCC 50920]|eukprot:KDD73879.1 hypothetical protein H632_c1763p0 [Helicosporidium sp. ATCC 50920]